VLGLVAGNGLLALARRWMNASAHVSVTTFAVLWVTDVVGTVFIWLLVLSPMMMLSRTALREHTWREAVAGALLGIVTYCCFVGTKNWSWIS
jgi:membrane-associated phospholipid phosphatase